MSWRNAAQPGADACAAATRDRVPLAFEPVSDRNEPGLPFVCDIAMGVRREDTALRDALDEVIERRRADIDAILGRFGVPRVQRRD